MNNKILYLIKAITDSGYHLFRIITSITLFVLWLNIVRSKALAILVGISAAIYIMQPVINKWYWNNIEKTRK